MITTTSFGKYYKFSVSVGNEIGVIFLSDQMNEFLSQVTNIHFCMGHSSLCPANFISCGLFSFQWEDTLYLTIHCLLTGNWQHHDQAIFRNHQNISQGKLPHIHLVLKYFFSFSSLFPSEFSNSGTWIKLNVGMINGAKQWDSHQQFNIFGIPLPNVRCV